MKILDIILGAGFSFNAGLPLVAQLSSTLETDYRNKLLRWSSSEWRWTEGKDSNEIFHGQMGGDHVAYAYLMNEVVRYYTTRYGPINNFEIFYDFLETAREDWYNELGVQAQQAYVRDSTNPREMTLDRMRILNKHDVIELVTYLIADSLTLNKPLTNILPRYIGFLQYLQTYEQINIHTLNHDLLLERLLETMGLEFSDGFTKTNSELKSTGSGELLFGFLDKLRFN